MNRKKSAYSVYFGECFRGFRCTLFTTNLIGMFAFLSCFKLTIYSQYKHILCQVSRKMTNLSCFCQKSELNSKKIGVFRCFGGISVIRRTQINSFKVVLWGLVLSHSPNQDCYLQCCKSIFYKGSN